MISLVDSIGSAGISLLLAVAVAVFVLVAFYVARGPREKPAATVADDRVERMERAIECLQGEIRQWRHIASQLGTRQRQLEERQDSIDLRDGAEHAYRMAIKMARRGAPPSELADTCGLTRGEAELLSLMHQGGGAAAPAPDKRKRAQPTPVRKIA